MTTPSTADSSRTARPTEPIAESGAQGPGGTRPAVEGESAPRLPHERDESSDSAAGGPSEVGRKAADDAERGRTDPPRGPQTQRRYSDLTEAAGREADAADRRSAP